MTPLTSRGSRPCWLYVISLFLAALGGFSPESALARLYPKEYITKHPQSFIAQEGSSVVLELEYALGDDLIDLEPVYWYRNGKYLGSTTPVLQTYTTTAGPRPKLWDPYVLPRGRLYDNEATAATAGDDARARWIATFRISAVSANEAGIYYAKVGNVGTDNGWTYTNFAQVAMVPVDPSSAMEIVRNPLSKSLSPPNSNPAPSLKLYGDMRSHISPLLRTPFGTATDSEGFTFIADTLNHCIRRVSPGGHVTTLAGLDGQPSSYNEPSQYDLSNRSARTRKERDPVPGSDDGTTNQSQDLTAYRFFPTTNPVGLAEPKFRGPEGITISDIGIVYVADTGNNAIRRIRTVGNVTTVSTLYGGLTSSALRSPRGVFFGGSSSDPLNNPPVLYVLDSANYSVKKLFLSETDGGLDTSKGDPDVFNPTQKTGCENIAGLGQTPGWQGVAVSGAEAKFYSPRGIVHTVDPATLAETIYIADTVNHVIRQITKTNNVWTVRTVVGFVGAKGNVNDAGSRARLNYPVGLALDEVNQLLYFTEFGTHSLRRVHLPFNSRNLPSWTVDLVAGSGFYGPTLFGPNGPQGTGDGSGIGAAAVFYYPAGISFNKTDGSILLTDTNNNALRKVSIATSGPYAWIGDSSAFAGTVGVAGNRDFSELEEFSYNWKRDGLLLTDNPSALASSISGSLTDTLAIDNAQYEDAGVYALVVTNAFEEVIETVQSQVYLATAGDQPRFLNPGYRIENQLVPGVPLEDLQKGLDLYVFADILPADQVTYQWEVAEDVPDINGEFVWIALSDLPIGLQTFNNPRDVDTLKNDERIRLGTLLGTHTTTISGSTTPRLAIGKLQASLTAAVPPKLRFRVQSETKAVPAFPLDTKLQAITLSATWTVAAGGTDQTVTVDSGVGLSVGMYLVGSGMASDTKITAIDTSNPEAVVLTLDKAVLAPGSNVQISGALDLVAGTGRPVRFPVVFSSPDLSIQINGSAATPLTNAQPYQVVPGNNVKLNLVGGSGAAQGYPAPTYQWKKRDPITGLSLPISGATQPEYTIPSIKVEDRAYYSVTASNSEGVSVESNSVLVDVERPSSLTILSMLVDGGSFATDVAAIPTRVVDKKAAPGLTLRANVDASSLPTYTWTFTSDYTAVSTVLSAGTAGVVGTGVAMGGTLTYGELTISEYSDDANGVFKLTVTVPPKNGAAEVTRECSWRVTVRPPNVKFLTMTELTGSTTSAVAARQEIVVDKTKSPALSLKATVEASVEPTYTWTFTSDYTGVPTDITAVGANVQVGGLTEARFSVADLSDDADGVYTLKASVPARGSLAAASTECSWHVTVQYLPKFVPGSKVFLVGTLNLSTGGTTQDAHTLNLSDSNTLSLRAEFKTPRTLPKLSYRWRRDKTVLDSTEDFLDLPLVARRDIGEYKLEVTNELGMVSISGWKLNASGKPSVVVQPNGKVLLSTSSNLSAGQAGMLAAAPRISAVQASAASVPGRLHVARGQRLALQVTVDADPLPTYQWYRVDNGIPVPQAGAVSAIYVLPTITSVAGTILTYYVKANNPSGEVTSEPIEIRVDEPPEVSISAAAFVSDKAVPMPYPIGSQVLLTANVKDAGAQQSFQWKVNGNEIFGATQQVLPLSNIEAGQAGKYSVVVKGVAGTKESASLALLVRTAGTAPKYKVTFEGAEKLKTKVLMPNAAATGCAAGTKVMLLGSAPVGKMIQSWEVSYLEEATGQAVVTRLPSRAAKFVMPSADVTATPVLSRSYAGNYSGLLSLEAPWDTASEWPSDPEVFFRPTRLDPDIGKVRGLFSCSVTGLGAVSGQIQLENKTYSFTTVLDPEMKATFRVATILKGVAWSMKGELSFNPTEENRRQGFLDNVLHVVFSDAILATPPVVEAGQTLYCSAAGVSGAADALSVDVIEGRLAERFAKTSVAAPVAPAGSGQGIGASGVATAVPTSGLQSTALAAPGAPVIDLEPTDTSVRKKETAIFVVIASGGTLPFSYQWYKGVTSIPGKTLSTLTIPNVDTDDFGTYSVVVRSSGASGLSTSSRFARLSEFVGGDTGGTGGPGVVLDPGAPMNFTAAVYREVNGETNGNTFGQGAVLSVQVRRPTGVAIVQGYLANGTKVTASTSLGRAFTAPEAEGADVFENQPAITAMDPFVPTLGLISGQAVEAISETLVRRTSSPSIPLWFRGDSATEPVFGTMVFNGPDVFGSLGVLNLNSSTKLSEYTPNALAGYFFDADEPHLANVPTKEFVANQTSVSLTTDSYVNGINVSWPVTDSTPVKDIVLATVDRTTGLLIGGMLESTGNYVRKDSTLLYSPSWAAFKDLLACTTAGVVIQKRDILPGLPWTANPLGGYVGFLYRGKSAPVERLRNVLGNGTPEVARLLKIDTGRVVDTNRVERFLINITEAY